MNEERFQDWCEGKLADAELTREEIRWLENLVLEAISQKMLDDPDVMMFEEHPTLQ